MSGKMYEHPSSGSCEKKMYEDDIRRRSHFRRSLFLCKGTTTHEPVQQSDRHDPDRSVRTLQFGKTVTLRSTQWRRRFALRLSHRFAGPALERSGYLDRA